METSARSSTTLTGRAGKPFSRIGTGTAGAFLDHVLHQVALTEPIVVARVQARPMKEDFLPVVSPDETEAPIANHLLDLAATFRSTGRGGRPAARGRRALSATAPTSASRRAESIGVDELVAKQVEGDRQILETLLFRRKQDLAFFGFDDAVAKAGILVRHEQSRFNLVESQHDAFPIPLPVREAFGPPSG